MGAKRVLWSEHVGTSTKAEHAREQNMDRVPMSSPDVTDAEREVVMKALHTPVLSIGPYVQQFEQRHRRSLALVTALQSTLARAVCI
jgi:hypothetical protein